MKRIHLHSSAVVALAAGLVFCTLLAPPASADDKKEALTAQQNAAKEEYEAAQEKLEALQQQQAQTESQIGTLEGQSAHIAAQLEEVYAARQEAERLLLERQNEADTAARALVDKQTEYDASRDRCRDQLRAMQMLDGGGSLGLLAQADSLYQLLSFTDVLQQISTKNNEILTRLQQEADALDQARQAAEAAAREAEAAKAELDSQQARLDETQTQLQEALQQANETLSEQEAAGQAQQVVTEAAKKAFEEATAALDAYARSQSDRYTTDDLILTSLDFRCPLDSYSSITTRFGEADPWGIPHRGTDFAAANGTPIYAIASGVISAAGPVSSYGNCVQVSHGTTGDGSRYDSLYAHMSRIAVNQGQQVEKGEIIGYVGNTGNVYGANGGYHLHLELRVNGSRVDPLAYVPR